MDNQEQLPPLLELTELQQHILFQRFQELTGILASFQFNDPEKDQLMMRQHAALSGQREMLLHLLQRDDQIRDAAEQQKNATLNFESDEV